MSIKKIAVLVSGCVTLFLALRSYGMSDLEYDSLEQQVWREIREGDRLLKYIRARQERKDMIKAMYYDDMLKIRLGTVSENDVRRWYKEAKDWVNNGVRWRLVNSDEADIAEMMCRNAVSRADAWYFKTTGQFFEYSSRPNCPGPEQNAWDVCQFIHWAYTK